MCGITGLLHLDGRPVEARRMQAMTDAVAHRGPDGEGCWIEGGVGLGHRRLAILDLTDAAAQPMLSSDGRFVLTYNGEIYNFQDIREELEVLGRRITSTGDTEVLLSAIEQWGVKAACLKINGMFALGVWDRRERRLTLARDRYGIKPVYYHCDGRDFVFGSEIKAILASGLVQSRLDTRALTEYLTFQNFFSQNVLFDGVKILPAGSIVEIGLNGIGPRLTKYWDYTFQEPEAARSDADYLEELDHLFQQAVKRQLISDVDVGSYLSGGMDSGSITALAARRLPYVRTFTVGFDLSSASGVELGFDERQAAERMSYAFKTEQYEMVLKAGDMERAMPRLTRHIEEPRVGQSYPNFYAAQLASKFVKVVLSGAGGDELFAGYPWRYYRAVVNADFDSYVDKYQGFWQRLLDPSELKRVLRPLGADADPAATNEIFRSVFAGRRTNLHRPEDYVNESLYFEAKTFLHGLLVVEDKLSMAHSLESRVPFLDNDLVDFAMRLPVRYKLGNLSEVVRANENDPAKASRYYEKTRDGKLILRKLMSRYIPAETADAAKQGFSAPDASWFKGESMDYVRRRILNPNARIYAFMDPDAVKALVGEHLEGRCNRRLLIWSLLSLEEWCDAFL